jgi:hypothetical protein
VFASRVVEAVDVFEEINLDLATGLPVAAPDELDLSGKSGEHQLRNQEVFYGKREQTDAGVSA